jgi:hemoglobin
MSETVSGTTIYQRIGGEAAISAAVDRFYERVLADPTLSHFFSGVSMARLKAHQFAFLSQALGGPKQYSGASMRDAHSRLAQSKKSEKSKMSNRLTFEFAVKVRKSTIRQLQASRRELLVQLAHKTYEPAREKAEERG